jgi:hypothetical protein
MSRWPADRARTELLRVLEPHAGAFTVLRGESRDWASALFVGARHRLALALDGPDAADRADRLRETLPEMELDLRGGFVADCQAIVTLVDGRPVLGIEALTIEEAETPGVSRAVRRAG